MLKKHYQNFLIKKIVNDPNLLGEFLRDYCFIPDQYGGNYGCYSTFDLRPEFREVEKNSQLGRKLLKVLGFDAKEYKRLLNSNEYYDQWDAKIYEETFEFSKLFSNGEIHLAWHWDGDGCLVFIFEKLILQNTDCKKDYEWEFINDK